VTAWGAFPEGTTSAPELPLAPEAYSDMLDRYNAVVCQVQIVLRARPGDVGGLLQALLSGLQVR